MADDSADRAKTHVRRCFVVPGRNGRGFNRGRRDVLRRGLNEWCDINLNRQVDLNRRMIPLLDHPI